MDRKSRIRVIYEKVEEIFSFYVPAFLSLLLCIFITGEIMSRAFFNHSFYGVVDVVEQSVFLLTFLSLASVQAVRGHITMDMLPDKLKGRKSGYFLDMLLLAMSLFVVAVMFIEMIWFLQRAVHTNVTTATLFLPAWPLLILGIIGLFLVGTRLFLQMKDAHAAMKLANEPAGKEA